MAKKETKKDSSGLGLASAVIGAVATGFFLYGPKGAENRKQIKAWTLKAKAEVLEKFEKLQEVSDETYNETVDTVTGKYAKLKTVGEEEADKLNKELKRHWKAIKKVASEKKPAKKKVTKE
jgi:gas vesicle protein